MKHPKQQTKLASFQRDTEGATIKHDDPQPKLEKGPDILAAVMSGRDDYELLLTGFRRHYLLNILPHEQTHALTMEVLREKFHVIGKQWLKSQGHDTLYRAHLKSSFDALEEHEKDAIRRISNDAELPVVFICHVIEELCKAELSEMSNA